MKICIYGASGENLDKEYFEAARKLGQEIAKGGHTLIFGGGNHGLMGACVRGVDDFGGKSIGIAPAFFQTPGILYENCTELIITETMAERKQNFERLADCFAVLPGGIGTFEEFFETITLKQLGQLDKPVAILNTRGYYDEIEAAMERADREGFMREGTGELYRIFAEPEEIVAYFAEEIQK